MKFSKYCLKAVTFLSWPYFKSSTGCPSNKATTICGYPADNLRQIPVRHNQRCVSAEIKVRFAPPIMCRLTPSNHSDNFQNYTHYIFYKL